MPSPLWSSLVLVLLFQMAFQVGFQMQGEEIAWRGRMFGEGRGKWSLAMHSEDLLFPGMLKMALGPVGFTTTQGTYWYMTSLRISAVKSLVSPKHTYHKIPFSYNDI